MSRKARVKSSLGIYHVLAIGDKNDLIFEKEIHKYKAVEIIKNAKKENNINVKKENNINVIAYCLLNDHIHMVLKVEDNKLENIMKSMNVKYSIYYNRYEKRHGHVFQDRFGSEAIENNDLLLGVLRYIHNHPLKMGIVDYAADYCWSSAKEYVSQYSDLIDFNYLNKTINLFKDNNKLTLFHDISDEHIYLDTKEEENINKNKITNNKIQQYLNENRINNKENMTYEERIELANILLKLNFLTYCQVSYLSGLKYYEIINMSKVSERK